MNIFNKLAMCTAITTVITLAPFAAASAAGCPKTDVVGTWTDSLAGAVATITTEKAGTAESSLVCSSKTLKVKVSKLTTKGATFTAVPPKGCTTKVTAVLTYEAGSCTTASGVVTISGLGTFDDTWTKSTTAVKHGQIGPLADGFK